MHGVLARFSWLFVIVVAASVGCGDPGAGDDFADVCFDQCDTKLTLRSGPELPSFDDLLVLSPLPGRRNGERYSIPDAPLALEDDVNALLDTPEVSNKAFHDGIRPHRPDHPTLGPSLRAMFWNIERGAELPAIEAAFSAAADPAARSRFLASRVNRVVDADEVTRQLEALSQVDVVILNEVDRFVARTGNVDVVAELADHLQMNYAWGAEFLEIDPVVMGTEPFVRSDFLPGDADSPAPIDDGSIPESELMVRVEEANELARPDRSVARQLHGNAVLSRYPILSARLIPLRTVCWDWNAGERQRREFIQKGKELLAEKLFLEKVSREIRHGGRNLLIVDLVVPGLTHAGTTLEFVPGVRPEVLTVVSTHLENKGKPGCRADQMEEVVGHIAHITNPVILAGDLNTFGSDGRPTTIRNLLLGRFGNPQWVARQLITRFVGYSSVVLSITSAINMFRLKDDPTGVNIPILFPNPEKGLFDAVEDATFADAGRFDFRGDETRTVNGTAKTLANSNQRDGKGFKTTHALARTIQIGDFTVFGRWKIDWMFVRGYARTSRDAKATYRMAPHFPRTLEELNDSAVDPGTGEPARMSDHAPLTVVMPLGDTCPDGSCVGNPVPSSEFTDITWDETFLAEGGS